MRVAAQLLLAALAACSSPPSQRPLALTAITFNTGTSEGQSWTPDSGYGPEQALLSDQHYGDGLAWLEAVERTRAYLQTANADVVGFQEIFHAPDCATVPAAAKPGFVCERWQVGDPTVAQEVVGDGFQVACNLGKPDKCLAVRESFGRLRGCGAKLCLDGLAGGQVAGCGSGSRVGRGVIELAGGGTLTVVLLHGTSGVSAEDAACRVKQIEQVFVDLGAGDGPAASGERNLILGDFNTDPGRLAPADPSAVRWRDFVNPKSGFHFVTPVGPDVEPTYAGLVNIDHQVSDSLRGTCTSAPVLPFKYFDHQPQVCSLSE